MNTYTISYRYSKNGKSWTSTSTTVKADTDVAAIMQVQSKYHAVKDIKITAKR